MLRLDLPVTRHRITYAGRDLSVLVAGRESPAPPVLAIHGFGSSAENNWQVTGHLIALVRAGRRVIAVDLPGHGHSAKPVDPDAYSTGGLAGAAAAALDEFGDAGPADLLGYSLGSWVSWELLVGPGGRRWRRAVLGGYAGGALFAGVDPQALQRVLSGADVDPASAEVRSLPRATRRVVEIATAVRGNSLPALAAMATALAGATSSAGAPGVPVLVATGALDPGAAASERLAGRLPDARFLSVPDRGHINVVTSAPFRRGVVEFLGR